MSANCSAARPFAGGLPSPVVNQADEIEIFGHGGQLSANSLQGEKEAAVFHDLNNVVGRAGPSGGCR